MVRLISSLFLLLVFSAGPASAQTRMAQFKVNLDQIPVRVSLDQAFQKIEINKPATLTATLKDVHGATVPARKEHKVQLHYRGQILNAVIPAGKTSATFEVTPKTAGIEKIEISVSDLAGFSGFVICIDPRSGVLGQISRPFGTGTVAASSAVASARPSVVMAAPIATPAADARGRIPDGPFARRRRETGGVPDVETASAAPASGVPAVSGTGRAPAGSAGPSATDAAQPASTGSASHAAATLKVFVQPDPVVPDPESGLWKAQIALALVGKDNQLIASNDDLPLHLLTQIGQVSPANVTIKKNESSTFSNPVTLTSSQPGTDVLQILSSLPGVQHEITYHQPQPAGLRLEATPGEVINDGKSPVRVVVMLVDAGKTMVNASQNIEVVLGSTGGTITPAKLIVPAGQCCAEAKLTSAQHGAITITANALQLPAATIPAVFLFPWMMVMMGALGGLLGAFVHNPKAAISSHWWIVLVLGLIFGVILSIAAMFGVIGSLPKLGLPIQLSQIPSANELGALLLGFVGGFYGKKLWLKGGGDEDKEKEKGPHKGKAKEKAAAQPA